MTQLNYASAINFEPAFDVNKAKDHWFASLNSSLNVGKRLYCCLELVFAHHMGIIEIQAEIQSLLDNGGCQARKFFFDENEQYGVENDKWLDGLRSTLLIALLNQNIELLSEVANWIQPKLEPGYNGLR